MSFLDDLTRAAQSPTSVWHQFVVAHDPQRNDWYIFVEGRLDITFYSCILRSVAPGANQLWAFRCDGRRGVIAVRDEVRRSHPACPRCLFFVDKDFSDVLGETLPATSDLFCTDVYSIENYFVSTEALEVTWTQLWSLTRSDCRWSTVEQRFLTARRAFYRAMIPLMAWIVLARKNGLRPNVNNVNPSELVAFEDCVPKRRSSALSSLERTTSCAFRPSFAEWLGQARRLTRLSPPMVVRGKFDLWFFSVFLEMTFRALRSTVGTAPDGSIQRSEESIARALIGKLQWPRSLMRFAEGAVAGGGERHC